MHRKTPVYVEIASEIQDKIEKSFYKGDNKLPSRKELCEIYKVSDMTAWKVHNELEKTGAAYRVKGSGVYAVQKTEKEPSKRRIQLNSVKKIAFFSYAKQFDNSKDIAVQIFNGAQKRAFGLGLNIRSELFSPQVRGSYHIMDDEGLIVPYNSGCDWLFPMMDRKRVRSVLVNNYFSEAHCILNDNYSGMCQLIDYLESKGCRKLILATRHFNALGIANLSDRTYAFGNECHRRGLTHEVITNGNFSDLLGIVNSSRPPEAVMFTSDTPALKFKDILEKAKIKKQPFVTGYDGWCPERSADIGKLTTIKVDYEGMGAAAVDLMLKNTLEDWNLPDVIRVPCKLYQSYDEKKKSL